MESKRLNFAIQGMTRDWSPSKFNPKFAFENKNLRIVATENSTTASIENEKGTLKVDSALSGTPIGHAVINDQLVVFTHETAADHIYKIYFSGTPETLQVQELYSGPLGFSVDHPIECTTFYENEELQKVYWTDNNKPLRVINIAATQEERTKWTNIEAPFDFVGPVGTNAHISISKRSAAGGVFAPGVIQYSFSYFNLYGQETNIFYTSPLYYTSEEDRGAEADTSVSNVFDITLENLDPNYDYVRIYSTLRTSLDAIPQARKVADVKIKPETTTIKRFEAPITFTRPTGLTLYNTYSGVANLSAPEGQCIFIEGETEGLALPVDYYLYSGLATSGKVFRIIIAGTNNTDTTGTYYQTAAIDTGRGLEYPVIDPSSTSNLLILRYGDSFDIKHLEISLSIAHGFAPEPITITTAANIQYTDTGNYNEAIAPTDLLYVGGESVTAKTLDQKDNTLFIGNIKDLHDNRVSQNIQTILKAATINTGRRAALANIPRDGYYPYKSSLGEADTQSKGFKRGDVYRLGVQLQTKDGKWTQPVYIDDVEENFSPDIRYDSATTNSTLYLPKFTYTLSELSGIQDIVNSTEGYTHIRPVVVFPSELDRNIICQGIINPTVYNTQDRYENGPFVQASWFFRPNAPYNVNVQNSETITGDDYKYSPEGIMKNGWPLDTASPTTCKLDNTGAWVEFRHNYYLPTNAQTNCEIQSTRHPDTLSYTYIAPGGGSTTVDIEFDGDDQFPVGQFSSSIEVGDFVNSYNTQFFVDQSIFTINSPEIEYRDKFAVSSLSNSKFRIVGYAELTSSVSKLSVETSTAQACYLDSEADQTTTTKYTTDLTPGFIESTVDIRTTLTTSTTPDRDSLYGWRCLVSSPAWWDTGRYLSKSPYYLKEKLFCYIVYPWQKTGSLNNDKVSEGVIEPTANLKHKVLSNLRTSYKTQYLINYYTTLDGSEVIYGDYFWEADGNAAGIGNPIIWDSEEQTLEKLNISGYDSSLIYYGNVDKLLIHSGGDGFRFAMAADGFKRKEDFQKLDYVYTTYERELFTDFEDALMPPPASNNFGPTTSMTSNDPVSIKYKSTPHVIVGLNINDHIQYILPTHSVGGVKVNNQQTIYQNMAPYWDATLEGVQQSGIEIDPKSGYLWIGELYNPDVNEETRFGGKSEEAIENNTWVPCGEPVSLTEDDGTVKSSITLEYTEGDTYYQRYDCLKTYPYTKEDLNSVVEIVSFMVETHINLDGRYDRNRGLKDNTNVSNTNFNLLNPVYTQKNNFFNYTLDRSNRINLKKYPTTFSWSLPKVSGEAVDSWTSVTLANTYELDGRFGELNAIRKFNDGLFTFQDKGISQILYNDNVQIATSTGVPIEIANSGKVQGVRYLSTDIGCTNKFSICRTPNGLYFVDSLAKDIYLFNGQFSNLSDKNGFHTWVNSELSNIGEWNPSSTKNCITFYDRTTGDIRFTTNTQCLTFSETTGNFSSFFDYEDTPVFGNIKNRGVMLHKEGLGNTYYPWLFREGDYNSFFGVTKPFYTTLWVNPDGQYDKVFTNIEFRADTWNGNTLLDNTTFDKLTAHTEYQDGSVNLSFGKGISNLKKKFRIWRANIPRDLHRQYMRNPWLQLQLKMNSPSTYRTELHDIAVDYFI